MSVFYPFQLSCLFNALLSFLIGLFVLTRSNRKSIKYTFFAISFSIFIWSLGMFLEITSQSKEFALAITHIFYIAVSFIPVFYMHFVFSLLRIEKKYRKILISAYFVSLGLLV